MIQEQAEEYAKELQKDEDFNASNGWLDRFKSRHNIGGSKLSGEHASVDPEAVHSWKERLPEIINGYNPCDIYNMDKTGLFEPYLTGHLWSEVATVLVGRSLKSI